MKMKKLKETRAIGASLRSLLYFGHPNFRFLNGVKPSNEACSLIPMVKRCAITQLKHLMKTPTQARVKHVYGLGLIVKQPCD